MLIKDGTSLGLKTNNLRPFQVIISAKETGKRITKIGETLCALICFLSKIIDVQKSAIISFSVPASISLFMFP